MSRTVWVWSLIGLVGLSTGCAMCAHPYDYCGPTAGACGPQCDPLARSGSILAGGPVEPVAYGTPVKTPQPTKAPLRSQPAPAAPAVPSTESSTNFFPGIPRENILSVTDRRLDEVQSEEGVAQEQTAEQQNTQSQTVQQQTVQRQQPARMKAVRSTKTPARTRTHRTPARTASRLVDSADIGQSYQE